MCHVDAHFFSLLQLEMTDILHPYSELTEIRRFVCGNVQNVRSLDSLRTRTTGVGVIVMNVINYDELVYVPP